MHIILGVLGALITILILVKRLNNAGFDAASFNPFLWYRRHRWRQQLQRKPLHNLDDPLEVAAILWVATAKADGDLSAEQKRTLLHLFETECNQSARDASALLTNSVFLLKDEASITTDLTTILKPSQDRFTLEQRESTLQGMQTIAAIDGSIRPQQQDLIDAAIAVFKGASVELKTTW